MVIMPQESVTKNLKSPTKKYFTMMSLNLLATGLLREAMKQT